MASISITAYALSVKSKRNDEKYSLNDFEDDGFLEVFNRFIEENRLRYENSERLEKIFKFEDCEINSIRQGRAIILRYITGTIKTGSYGLEAEIVNRRTGDVNYTKNEEDAEVMPFHFIVAIPEGEADKGVLILQKNGVYGIKTLFEDVLSDYLSNVDNDYKLSLGNVAPAAYLDRLLDNGILQKVRFLRFNIPHDVANQLGMNNGVRESYEEYVINKPVGFIGRYRDFIKECVRGQREINRIIELRNFDFTNMKLEFKFGNKYKTINLGDVSSIGFNEDITDQVTLLGGHPTPESIEPILLDTATMYLEEMGLLVRR